jgi:tetratricopeptide (TPR) repeat protein
MFNQDIIQIQNIILLKMKNTILILLLIALVIPFVNSYSQKKDEKNETIDNKVLEERINGIKKEMEYKIDNFYKERSTVDSHFNDKLKENYAYQKDLFWTVSILLTVFLAILGFMFKNGVIDYIQNLSQKKVEETVNKLVTKIYIDNLIGKNANDKIKEKINQFDNLINNKTKDFDLNLKNKIDEIDKLIERYKELEKKVDTENLRQDLKTSKEQEKNIDEIVNITEKLKNVENYNYKDWFLKGYDEFIKDNFKNSIQYFSKAIELKNDYSDAYNYRGLGYNHEKEYEKALNDFDKVLSIDNDNAAAYNNKGLVYSNKGNYNDALEMLLKSKELNSDEIIIHINLVRTLTMKGDFNEALKAINETRTIGRDLSDLAVIKLYECMINKYLEKDTKKLDEEFDNINNKKYESGWSFDYLEEWLKNSDLTIELKSYVLEKINLLKLKNPKLSKRNN